MLPANPTTMVASHYHPLLNGLEWDPSTVQMTTHGRTGLDMWMRTNSLLAYETLGTIYNNLSRILKCLTAPLTYRIS